MRNPVRANPNAAVSSATILATSGMIWAADRFADITVETATAVAIVAVANGAVLVVGHRGIKGTIGRLWAGNAALVVTVLLAAVAAVNAGWRWLL